MMSGNSDCMATLPPEKEPIKSDAHFATKPAQTFRRRHNFLNQLELKHRIAQPINYTGFRVIDDLSFSSFNTRFRVSQSQSQIRGNKMPTRCNRGFYCRSYCLLNMLRAPLCPSSGAQEYYTVVAACGISCCGFQVAGLVWS